MIVKYGAVAEALTAKHGCPIWEAQDGMLTPLMLMNEGHLRNAHRYCLKRRAVVQNRAILAENIERLLGDDEDDWLLTEERTGRDASREIERLAYVHGMAQVNENLIALEAEAQRRGIVLEGSEGSGENDTRDRSGVGVPATGIGKRIAGYCRGLAAKIRLPHLDCRG